MPFTVTYLDAGIKRHEFDAYVRLLEKRGIDWTNIPRVQEPESTNQWLYVWDDQTLALAFRDELRRETKDVKWELRELHPGTPISEGPLMLITILMRRNSRGADFALHPHSQRFIQRRFPDSHSIASISIESTTLDDFQRQHGSIWDHIAQVLSGLTMEKLASIGGFVIVDPAREQIVYQVNLRQPAA